MGDPALQWETHVHFCRLFVLRVLSCMFGANP